MLSPPTGSRVVIDGAFDNSGMNPGAADPTVPALGGLQTREEMFIGYFTYRNTREIRAIESERDNEGSGQKLP